MSLTITLGVRCQGLVVRQKNKSNLLGQIKYRSGHLLMKHQRLDGYRKHLVTHQGFTDIYPIAFFQFQFVK